MDPVDDELVFTEQEFADYAVDMLDALTRLALSYDRTLLAIASYEARRLKVVRQTEN